MGRVLKFKNKMAADVTRGQTIGQLVDKASQIDEISDDSDEKDPDDRAFRRTLQHGHAIAEDSYFQPSDRQAQKKKHKKEKKHKKHKKHKHGHRGRDNSQEREEGNDMKDSNIKSSCQKSQEPLKRTQNDNEDDGHDKETKHHKHKKKKKKSKKGKKDKDANESDVLSVLIDMADLDQLEKRKQFLQLQLSETVTSGVLEGTDADRDKLINDEDADLNDLEQSYAQMMQDIEGTSKAADKSEKMADMDIKQRQQ